MSDDLNGSIQMAAAIGQCDTSGSTRPKASRSDLAHTPPPMSPTPSPMRVKTLAPLLRRENVRAILSMSGIKSLRVSVEFEDGRSDNKTIWIAPGGSIALLLLDDNPDQIKPGAFYDLRPA